MVFVAANLYISLGHFWILSRGSPVGSKRTMEPVEWQIAGLCGVVDSSLAGRMALWRLDGLKFRSVYRAARDGLSRSDDTGSMQGFWRCMGSSIGSVDVQDLQSTSGRQATY